MDKRMKILIAYDGSDCSDAALSELSRAGLPEVAEATVVSVAELWLPPPSSYEALERVWAESPFDEEQKALAAAEQACERIRLRSGGRIASLWGRGGTIASNVYCSAAWRRRWSRALFS